MPPWGSYQVDLSFSTGLNSNPRQISVPGDQLPDDECTFDDRLAVMARAMSTGAKSFLLA